MNNTKKIPLSLAANYVSEWNTWCAVRELIQNAIDAGDYSINISYESNSISIESNGGAIPVSQLLLGNGTKSGDEGKIGKFGEGFKLALLILARQGYDVDIANGVDKWRSSIEYSEMFKAEHLHVKIKESVLGEQFKDRVIINIDGLSSEELEEVSIKYLPENHFENKEFGTDSSYGFHVEGDKSQLFVGGLYVCDLDAGDDEYAYSYNFAPSKLELDRDRNAVCSWNLQHEVSMLLVREGNVELLEELAREDRPDVRGYAEWQSSYGGSSSSGMSFKEGMSSIAIEGFVDQYGGKAFPISSAWSETKKQSIYDLAVIKGLKPVTIPKSRYEMLDKDKLPKLEEIENAASFDVISHLEDLIQRNKKHIRSKPLKELNETVNYLKLLKGLK